MFLPALIAALLAFWHSARIFLLRGELAAAKSLFLFAFNALGLNFCGIA
tara:strand:- start:1378 stop:1524 length:147 start_codon:yes stop_codon:yes gene_type:complete